ncbi:MAG: hypothetical protein AAGE85_07905 [Pseudomonadota bacterium]
MFTLMARARKHQISLESTPYYHVMSRCVRRAFLCGVDRVSGKSFEHRRGWVEDRVRVLASLFSIEICAYAILSNHYHLVVKLIPHEADDWSDDEVLERWATLFRGPLLVRRFCAGKHLSAAELDTLRSITAVYRTRLACLSWFMKCLNEPIARKANAEDGCTGHFWEARFQSQPLQSEQALFAAMAYVDLNPIRAGIADTPEQSDYTSIKTRIEKRLANSSLDEAINGLLECGELRRWNTPVRPLLRFADEGNPDDDPTLVGTPLALRWSEYLKLVENSGRIAVFGKRGRIDPALQPVLERLGLSEEQWLVASTGFRKHYRRGELRLVSVS